MRPKPGKLDKKHAQAIRGTMEDIKDMSGAPKTIRNDIRYMEPNRDRAPGEADRTGRHYDENVPAEAEDEETEG
jgi:hypothetical protein